VDKLQYTYHPEKQHNQLLSVTDQSGDTWGFAGTKTYTYNAVGSLLKDGEKEISWNVQQKVQKPRAKG
jgi:hypothetical protein